VGSIVCMKERIESETLRRDTLERTISTLRRISDLMDNNFGVPGTKIRFGWDSIVGLIPVIGDFLAVSPLGYYLWVAYRFKLGWSVSIRIVLIQGVDFLVGSVPLLGDIFDVGFKSNQRNAKLLLKKLERLKESEPD